MWASVLFPSFKNVYRDAVNWYKCCYIHNVEYYIAVEENDVLTEISMQYIESQNEKPMSLRNTHFE